MSKRFLYSSFVASSVSLNVNWLKASTVPKSARALRTSPFRCMTSAKRVLPSVVTVNVEADATSWPKHEAAVARMASWKAAMSPSHPSKYTQGRIGTPERAISHTQDSLQRSQARNPSQSRCAAYRGPSDVCSTRTNRCPRLAACISARFAAKGAWSA